jgi:septin family protein
MIEVDGEMVRGRKNRWGVINGNLFIKSSILLLIFCLVEDPTHSEFTHLREFLTR